MRLRTLFPLSCVVLISACVLRKVPETIWQLVPDSGVNFPKEAVIELGLTEELVKKVYSKENLQQAQTQLPSGRSFELNVLLREDWQTRLPIKIKSGSVKTFDDIDSNEDVVALGDLAVRNLKVNASAGDTLRKLNADVKIPFFEVVKFEINSNSIPELIASLNKIHKLPSVLFAEPNFRVQKIALPNDPSVPSLWGMSKISAPSAWDSFTGNQSVVVAVIDTGVELVHPDLKDNLWKNTKEIAGNGIDDDGNGYIDDVNGWDFAYGDNDPTDGDGHGTHCAGTIGARGNNGLGVAGVNWATQIMPVKVLDDSGSGYNYDIYNGLIYAIANGAKVTSNSYGGGGASSLMASAIKAAQDGGVLFVAAAGNDGASSANYPAYYTKTYTNVLSVASTESNDTLSTFSNYGNGVDVAAPGRNILSTSKGQSYVTLSGTSMATPHVAGMAAFLWAASPSKTMAQIRSAIVNNSDPVSALSGKVASNGRVNLKSALDSLGGVATPTPTASPTATPTASPTATPTASPTASPTAAPTATPTAAPTATPTAAPTATPTAAPTAAPTAVPTPTPLDGLRYRLYRGFWMRLPNFDNLMPSEQGVVNSISLSPFSQNNQFGVVFEGHIWVPRDGNYTFFLKSDDGSRLTIDGERWVSNDGLHGPREKTATRALTQGFHTIRVDYFQLFGGKALSLQWQGPDVSRRKLGGRGVMFHFKTQ